MTIIKISVPPLILYKYSTLISPEKIKQVRKQLSGGEPEGEIRNRLITEGYTKEEIDQCFPAHHYDMRSWYLIFGIFFSLIGIWLLMAYGNFLLLIFGIILLFFYGKEKQKISGSK